MGQCQQQVQYENISEEEFYHSTLDWWERRELLYEQQYQARRAFFSHNWDCKWQWLYLIPQEHQSPLLICDWCRSQATHFQTIPGKALFCSYCTKQLRKMRRAEYRRYERWREKAKGRRMAAVIATLEERKASS